MTELDFPPHIAMKRRDGRFSVILHRSIALLDKEHIEIKNARSTIYIPLLGILTSSGAGALIAVQAGNLPLWSLITLLIFSIFVFPTSVMGIVSSLIGSDVVIDKRKGSITWQQGYLGLGLGTRELVPFPKVEKIEITIEGDKPERWREEADNIRQFSLELIKTNGRRLILAQVPVIASKQVDGMDRTFAVGKVIADAIQVPISIPSDWELIELDIDTEHEEIKDPALKILMDATTIAVVGLDSRTERSAYQVAKYLQDQQYRIIPVPTKRSEKEVLGEKAWESLKDIPLEVDVVNLFVRSEQTTPFIQEAIEIGAKAIWLQLDIYNEPELAQARKVGIATTENRCTKIEHQLASVNKNKLKEI